jgi:hypothetical protein
LLELTVGFGDWMYSGEGDCWCMLMVQEILSGNFTDQLQVQVSKGWWLIGRRKKEE